MKHIPFEDLVKGPYTPVKFEVKPCTCFVGLHLVDYCMSCRAYVRAGLGYTANFPRMASEDRPRSIVLRPRGRPGALKDVTAFGAGVQRAADQLRKRTRSSSGGEG